MLDLITILAMTSLNPQEPFHIMDFQTMGGLVKTGDPLSQVQRPCLQRVRSEALEASAINSTKSCRGSSVKSTMTRADRTRMQARPAIWHRKKETTQLMVEELPVLLARGRGLLLQVARSHHGCSRIQRLVFLMVA